MLSSNCSKGTSVRKIFLISDCQRSGAAEQMVWDGLGASVGGSFEEQVGQTALQES